MPTSLDKYRAICGIQGAAKRGRQKEFEYSLLISVTFFLMLLDTFFAPNSYCRRERYRNDGIAISRDMGPLSFVAGAEECFSKPLCSIISRET